MYGLTSVQLVAYVRQCATLIGGVRLLLTQILGFSYHFVV